MPHITLPIVDRRCVVPLIVGVDDVRAKELDALGEPVPDGVPVLALIDTGADRSGIDPEVVARLNLKSRRKIGMATAAGVSAERTPVYDVLAGIVHQERVLQYNAPIAMTECVVGHAGFHALIGMDILSSCLLVVDGRAKTFALSF